MYVAEIIDIRHAVAGRTAAVQLQQLADFRHAGGICFGDVIQQIQAVGMVVGRQYLELDAAPVEIQRLVDQQLGHLAFFVQRHIQVLHIAAPAGVDQVIHAEPVDFFLFDQIQNRRQIPFVQTVECKPDPGAVARRLGRPDAGDGRRKGALLAPEHIMGFFTAVDADADVLEARFFDQLRREIVDQRPVGGQNDPQSLFHCVGRQLEQIRPYQWFAARKHQYRHFHFRQVVDERHPIGSRHLVVLSRLGGFDVAMPAFEIALGSDVPDHDRRPLG